MDQGPAGSRWRGCVVPFPRQSFLTFRQKLSSVLESEEFFLGLAAAAILAWARLSALDGT
jgi:hypothetical protein